MEHLDPSSWDKAYERELSNHSANPEDEGTIWFADADAEDKIIDYLESLDDEGTLRKEGNEDGSATTFLDLGTGNGHLLFALRDAGWNGKLVGVDYSRRSVELAKQIETKRQMDGGEEDGDEAVKPGVDFKEFDLLGFDADQPPSWLEEGFDVLLDKGTFDAISLSGQEDDQGRRIFEGYRERIEPLLKGGGLFLITSCNWTEQELDSWFNRGHLERWDKIKYPSFTFGGIQGQSVSSVVYKKKQG